MAGCLPSKFGDYSTLANLTQSADPAPTGFTARYTGVGSVTLIWTPPGDYATNPENYLGFFILKNFKDYGSSAPPVAPTKYNDPATPYAIPVYVGRNSQMGEATGLTDSFEQYFSDVDAGPSQSYAYSIFLIKSDLTYSVAATVVATTPGGDGTTVLIEETFAGATISGDDITSGMSSKGLDFHTDQPDLTSLSTGQSAGQQAVKIQGSLTVGTTITSDFIPSSGGDLEPNTLYYMRFWTRSTYNPADYTGDKEDHAANALSGVLTLATPNWNVLQQYQVVHQEDLPTTPYNTCSKNLADRIPTYDFGGSPPYYQYLGQTTNAVWTLHGTVFLTGAETADLPSSPPNLYGSTGGDPTQIFVPKPPAPNDSTAQDLQLTFNLGKIDKTAWTDASSISAELGSITITKGVYFGKSQYEKTLDLSPLNFLLNPTMSFDPTTTAVAAPGTTPGYPGGASLCPAAAEWVLSTGNFAYKASADSYYAVLKPTCSTATEPGTDSSLAQDIWYLSLIAGQTYEISFDAFISPSDTQELMCKGQVKYVCKDTQAVCKLHIDILDTKKDPVGTFTTLSLNGGSAVATGFGPTEGADLTSTQVATQNPAAVFNDGTCSTLDPLIGGWVSVKYTYVVPSLASAYKNLSPTLKITSAKDTIGSTPFWAVRNMSIAPQAADITAGKIAVPGFDMPNPIPTVPSSIPGTTTTPTNVQTWDFESMTLGGPDTGSPILPQLAGLNGAAVGASGPNKVGGMLSLSQKQSDAANLSVVTDATTGGTGGPVLCITCKSGSNSSALGGAVVTTSEYFTSGVFDCWVKVANVLSGGGQVTGNQPVGFTFADWLFSAPDYNEFHSAQSLMQFSPTRNPEIDIEIGGNCPKDPKKNTDYLYSIGRLNGWGGILGGDGGQFEHHAAMPSSFNLAVDNTAAGTNGYHKLTIVLNTGVDSAAPSNDHQTRTPGYIKWFVNDEFWSGGWLGAEYGTDNIPHTGMRFTVGPWAPDVWAGDLFEADGTTYIWDTAQFYMTKMSYTPLYDNGATDQTNYMIPPTSGSPVVSTDFANRDFYLPEFNPYNHFDPTCVAVETSSFSPYDAEAPEAAASEESEEPSFLDNVSDFIDEVNPFSSSDEDGEE